MPLNPDHSLTVIRQLLDLDPEDRRQYPHLARALQLAVRDLDDHLSGGGRPPEAWREGPDALD